MNLRELYTNKQKKIIADYYAKDFFLMINHGAVRAGKTAIDNLLFLLELNRIKQIAIEDGVAEPKYILGATSGGSLYSNILSELIDKYELDIKFDKYGNFRLNGVYVVTTFTGSIAGLKAIRGMTSYGAYINEATLANKEVFDEIIKRCSGRGSRIICDTNPDHPMHWLKTDYIDKADGERVIANHFTIFDNPFLDKRYVDNLVATTPSGMFTERGLYGKWVSGEGAVYRDFNESMYIDLAPECEIVFCGVDWGYEHRGVIAVIGKLGDDFYLLEEHSHQHLEIDGWVEIAKEIEKRYGKLKFYADSARPEYVARFNREGLRTFNANKSVIAGIGEVAKLMKQGRFFVVSKKVSQFKTEIYQYVWNERTGEPVKENDDTMDALRYGIYSYIITSRKDAPIENKINKANRLFRR